MTVATKIGSSTTSIPEGQFAQQSLAGEVFWRDYGIARYPFEVRDHSTSPDESAWSFHGLDNPFQWRPLRFARSIKREELTNFFARTSTDWIVAGHHGDTGRITHVIKSETVGDYRPQFYAFVLATDHSTDLLPRSFSSDWPRAERTIDPLEGYEQYAKPNWDGEDAQPITPQTLRYARELLNVMPNTFGPPDIAPSADGSIGLEWVPDAGPLGKLFLDIGPGEEWRAYWNRRNGEFGRLPDKGFTLATRRVLQELFDDLSK